MKSVTSVVGDDAYKGELFWTERSCSLSLMYSGIVDLIEPKLNQCHNFYGSPPINIFDLIFITYNFNQLHIYDTKYMLYCFIVYISLLVSD